MNFGEMGISEKLIMFSDGQNVAEYFDGILDSIELSHLDEENRVQPVSLLLLDINMPMLTGMEAIKRIKVKYEEANKRIEQQGLARGYC